MGFDFKGTGSQLSACLLIKLLFSNLLSILSVNNPTHMYLCDLRLTERLEALEEKLLVQEAAEKRSEEIKKVVERLVSFDAQLSIRLQLVEEKIEQLEQTLTKTDDRVEQLEQSQTNAVWQVELLKHIQTETAAKADQLDQRCAEVERIGLQLKTQRDKPGKLCLRLRD